MSNDVERVLVEHGVATTGLTVGDAASGLTFVFVKVHKDIENKQRPSNKKLSEVKDVLRLKGHKIEFVLIDAVARDLEAGLRATLLRAHGDDLRNVFLSVIGRRATLWIDPKRHLSDAIVDAIRRRASVLLEAGNIDLEAIESTVGSNLPTNTACLQTLRQIAPASMELLKAVLIERRLNIPSDDWLRRRLDSLRKAGSVVRNEDGTYALSGMALRSLGSGKGRASPDVKRVLAIARRRR